MQYRNMHAHQKNFMPQPKMIEHIASFILLWRYTVLLSAIILGE
jgi:hypothetical protein